MLTTFDRTQWKEEPEEVRLRESLDTQADPVLVRKHYPYMARVRKRLLPYQIAEGTIFKFARARGELNFYPIEAIVGIADSQTHVRRLYLSSDEVELMEV